MTARLLGPAAVCCLVLAACQPPAPNHAKVLGTPITPITPALAPTGPPPSRPVAEPWAGTAFRVQLGTIGDPGAAVGFNAAEASWQVASESPAYVLLPFKVSGRVHVKVEGWMPPAIAATSPVKIGIGTGKVSVTLSGKNEAHEVEFDVGIKGADRVSLESIISGPTEADSRKLGVGIVAIEISRR